MWFGQWNGATAGFWWGDNSSPPIPPVEAQTNTPGFLRNLPRFAPTRRREREELEIVERITAAAQDGAQAIAPQTALEDLEAALSKLETQVARALALQQIALIQAQIAIDKAAERSRQDDEAITLIAMALVLRR